MSVNGKDRDLPCDRPRETRSYIKVTTLVGEGFTWSLIALILGLVLGSLEWVVVIAPLAFTLGLVILSDKRDFPKD